MTASIGGNGQIHGGLWGVHGRDFKDNVVLNLLAVVGSPAEGPTLVESGGTISPSAGVIWSRPIASAHPMHEIAPAKSRPFASRLTTPLSPMNRTRLSSFS